jgi:hypothetical protein
VLPPVRAVDGRHVTIPVPGAKLTVVALVGETCPLSRKLGPTYTQLEARFRKQGVRVVYVNPSEIETAEETKHWAQRLRWVEPVVSDPTQELVRVFKAQTTTEVFLIRPDRTVVYRGAVDDQYGVGTSLPAPRNRYLQDAVDAVLAGKAPRVARTDAPGCLLTPPTSLPRQRTGNGKSR